MSVCHENYDAKKEIKFNINILYFVINDLVAPKM